MNADQINPSRATQASPLPAIAGFAALLRDHGMKVGIAEQQAMVKAALTLPIDRPRSIDAAWRAIACQSRSDWGRWQDLFEQYWYPKRLRGTVKVSGQTRRSRDMRAMVKNMQKQMDAAQPKAQRTDTALTSSVLTELPDGDPRAMGGASRTEALDDRSDMQWLPQDLTQLDQIARRVARRLRRKLTRRWHADPSGHRLDIRRTLRASLTTGGIPIVPRWRKPRNQKPQVFILVDVSRSMQTHAQLFLRISRAFVSVMGARVFVFHTRLAEITPLLQGNSENVQEKINAVTAGFGGGTRIATSIADFSRRHARGQLRRNARFWVLSDGFDADDPHHLPKELKAVRGRGVRITWFHPGAKAPASESILKSTGLIDRFIALNNLQQLGLAVEQID